MGFTTKECAWSHTSVKLLGATMVGLRGFEFDKDIEKEYLYAAGDEPIDIQNGNKGYPLNLKLLKYEVDKLNDAALAAGYEDILEVPHELIVITCQYKKRITDAQRTIVSSGVAFTSLKFAMEQNNKMGEVTLPGMAMKTVIR